MVLVALGVVLVRLSVTGEYLRFVTPWMRWPLLVTGVLLAALAVRPLLGARDADQDGVPTATWLLLLPTLVVLAVAPPPLGAYLAERRADQPVVVREPEVIAATPDGGPLQLLVSEFQWAAAQPDDPVGIRGAEVQLSGFVTRQDDGWYVTRLELFCCAADAMVTRARVEGVAAPPRNQWVEVTGTWVEGTGTDFRTPPVLEASQVVLVDAPANTYG